MTFSRSAALTGCCALLVLLTGCGGEDERADVSVAAAVTAEAISTGSFEGISLAAGTPQALEEAVQNLQEPFDGLRPEVEVAGVQVHEPEEDSVRPPTAEAAFEHVWELEEIGLDGQEWTYTTEADYTYDEESDTWLVDGETQIILPDYAGHENIGISTTTADRGRIIDGSGRAMVYNRDVVRIGLDKTQLESEQDQQEAARELAEVVGVNAETYQETVQAYGDEAFVEAITVRTEGGHVSAEDVEDIAGVHLQYSQLPLAESSDFAPNLLGRVGPVTAEHLEDDPTLSHGDMVGLSGIQAVHESTLRGVPGVRISMGETTLYSSEPEEGGDVHTGLLPRVQDLAQGIVDEQEVNAALVAIRPSDGAVLAAASHHPEAPQVDTATQSAYAPGSTFKMVSALAMLRGGLTPESTVPCPNSVTVHGQQFRNVPGFQDQYVGSIPFNTAVAVSCNTTFAGAWEDVSSADLAQAALDLGMDNDVGIGIQALKARVPEDSELNLHAANLFGQGTVETSTLGMAAVAASIADGRTVHPWLVQREDHPQEGGLTEEEGEQLRELMHGTVDYGTLSGLDPIPGPHVYAKTGTAEAGADDDTYSHTWVIGSQDDLAVAVFLEEGEWGSSTNGPLMREFLIGAREILDEQDG
ncbi:penicillin-binding transpeptidase domain-containing protein [Nesterenkonia muleiensis]|uniref:penicillin-binding transpeptidase domain-containing protein n=1 Tax=Nesterenkonia muleiensis TaxID=2282648 RepID=UPI000E771B2D|nr:penicillin-binding transpeptidase domain-containing protein [Nesterenkonia muleiensis]